jgi:transposase
MPSAAYFAGFFDGEGYVGVTHNAANAAISLRVTVTNNHKGICDLFAGRFGGSVTPPRHYGEKQGKGSWTWHAYAANAKAFLRAILPYVVVKKPQVELALDFPLGEPGHRVSQGVQAERVAIKETLSALKRQIFTAPTDEDWGVREALSQRWDVKRAITLYRSGMSTQQVADKLGIKQPTVSYRMCWTGEARPRSEAIRLAPRKDSALSRPEAKAAAKLYQGGLSVPEVARKLGFKPATVNYWLRRQGLTRSLQEAQVLRRRRERNTT